MLSAARRIFSFFWFAGRRSRRSRMLLLVCGLPVLAAAVVQILRLILPGQGPDGLQVFSDIIMAFYLQFLVLVLALFYGTSVCAEEVENKTLTYLTTRPVSKPAIIAGKYAAYTAREILMIAATVTASFLILDYQRLTDGEAWFVLARGLAVLALAAIAYTAVFTLAGAFLKKSVLFGLFFCFGWENVVQYFPGTTQKLTVMHYLKSILRPEMTSSNALQSFLFFRLDPSPVGTAVAMLFLISAGALALAAAVFSRKEYLFEE